MRTGHGETNVRITVVNSAQDAAMLDGQAQVYDFVVVSMKQLPDKYSISDIIKPVITPSHTTIVLIQNGIDIEVPIIATFPSNVVMSSVSVIGSATVGDNKVVQTGPDVSTVGPHYHPCNGLDEKEQLAKAAHFVDLYNAGLKNALPNSRGTPPLMTLTDDMITARWHKVLWNGTFNTVCALMHLNIGEVYESGGRERLIIPMMTEIWEVANAAGAKLPKSAIQFQAQRVAVGSPFRPSMLIDVEYKRPIELEVILGNPIRIGENLGIQTPNLKVVYELLRMRQWTLS